MFFDGLFDSPPENPLVTPDSRAARPPCPRSRRTYPSSSRRLPQAMVVEQRGPGGRDMRSRVLHLQVQGRAEDVIPTHAVVLRGIRRIREEGRQRAGRGFRGLEVRIAREDEVPRSDALIDPDCVVIGGLECRRGNLEVIDSGRDSGNCIRCARPKHGIDERYRI